MATIEQLLQYDPSTYTQEEKSQVRDYVNSRIEQLKKESMAQQQAAPTGEPAVEEEPGSMLSGIVDSFKERAAEVVQDPLGQFQRTIKPAANGAIKAVNETINAVNDLVEWAGASKTEPMQIPELDNADYKDSTAAAVAENVSRFVVGFAGAGKLLKPIKAATTTGQFAKASLQGAIADFTVFDPHEKRLSNLINEHTELGNKVTEYLAADPDDTKIEGRFKNALEGLIPGALIEGFYQSVRGMKSVMLAKQAAKPMQAVDDLAEPMAKVTPHSDELATPMYQVNIRESGDVSPMSAHSMEQRVKVGETDVLSGIERHTDDPKMLMQIKEDRQAQVDKMWDDYYASKNDKEFEYSLMEMSLKDQEKSLDNLSKIPVRTDAERELLARSQYIAKGGKPNIKVEEMAPIQVSEDRFQEFMEQMQRQGKQTDRMSKMRYTYEMQKLAREESALKETNLSIKNDDWLLTKGTDATSLRLDVEYKLGNGSIPRANYTTTDEQIRMAGADYNYSNLKAAVEDKRKASVDVAATASRSIAEESIDNIAQSKAIMYRQAAEMGLGAVIGGMTAEEDAPPEEVLFRAVLGGSAPWLLRKGYRAINKIGERTDEMITDTMGAMVSRPIHKLGIMGEAGKSLGKMMRHTELNIDQKVGSFMSKISKATQGMSKTELDDIASIMQGIKKPTTNKQVQAAKLIRNYFDKNINEAYEAGVIDLATKNKYLANKTYWPRVYNESLLLTKEGEKQWIDTLTKHRWSSEESMRNALNHILHGNDEMTSEFMKLAKKDGTTFAMSRDMAKKLFTKRNVAVARERSSHMERARKIHVENEAILEPFLVKDPKAVLTQYFYDVVRRNETSKVFGAKDEVAETLFRSIENTSTTRNADFARNVYYKSVGDSRSSMIAQNINLKDSTKRVLGQIDAFETLKLTGAQIINSGQAIVNGTVYLSKTMNPAKAFKTALTGVYKGLGREGRDFAARAGAANETTLLEITGEAMVQHSILGRELKGVLTPFEYINNPTKFLQATGFITVEKFNRTIASNMGKVYFEDLMAKKALIEAGKLTNKKTISKIKRAFDEMDIPFNKSYKELSTDEANWFAERAGLAFSDTVNYRNTATQLPYLWSSPYMRLFRKFRTFTFHHGAFIKEHVIKPAVKEGNFGPLMTYMSVGAGVGMSVSQFRSWVNGDDAELTNTEKYLKGVTSVGGLGIMQDSLASFGSGYGGRVAGAMGGPFVGDVWKMYQDVKSTAQGKLTPEQFAKRQALNAVGTFPGKKEMLEELRIKHESKKRSRERMRKRER